MKYTDIFKNSFMNEVSIANFSLSGTLMSILITMLIGIYIFFCYKYVTRKTFYSKNFNISLIAIAIITCGIISAIQSSIVISLGMVGALSIVRFRTAIKDPMDLAFLFWSISVGIISGAHLSAIAIIISLILTIVIMIFDRLPLSRAPQILVINAKRGDGISEKIESIVTDSSKSFVEKSRTIANGNLDLVYEIRVKEGGMLCDELGKVEGIVSVSLLKHDGEVTF